MKSRHSTKLAIYTRILIAILACAPTTSAHEDRQDIEAFVIANVRFTIIHELSHAVIDALDIPVLGRAEDAADQMAMLAWMRPHSDHVHQIEEFVMATEAWRLEWVLHEYLGHGVSYWSDHSLDIQRFYNLACLIGGSGPEYMVAVQQTLGLPPERAWFCEDEHRRSQLALDWVLGAHPPRASNDWSGVRVRISCYTLAPTYPRCDARS